MSGEREVASVQPGGRAPAPGPLAVVQAFINSHYDLEEDHGAELLATPAALAQWLARRGLTPRPVAARTSDLRRALAMREALRDLARVNGAGPAAGAPAIGGDPAAGADALARLDRAARGAPVEVGFRADGPCVRAADGSASAALGVLVALAAFAMNDGSWTRLKVCPGEHCGWAFYDHSRNQTGRWCSMAVCGSRAKARAHYRRRLAT